jgi:hypothetical protein
VENSVELILLSVIGSFALLAFQLAETAGRIIGYEAVIDLASSRSQSRK